jgi:hypothetical protein
LEREDGVKAESSKFKGESLFADEKGNGLSGNDFLFLMHDPKTFNSSLF